VLDVNVRGIDLHGRVGVGSGLLVQKERIAAAREELAAELGDWPKEEIGSYLDRHYPAYWLNVDLRRKKAHAEMIRQAMAEKTPLATAAATDEFRDITELTIYAPDHPRLLSIIAGACAAAGADIADAQIFTTSDGMALDSIKIAREFPREADELRRGGNIARSILQSLRGEIRLPDAVARKAKGRSRLKAFHVEPQVMIDNSWSASHTAIEINGLDRTGLLYDLTTALAKLNLNIASAHIATYGERAVDVFYVTDLTGDKIRSPARQEAITRRLLETLEPPREGEKRQRQKDKSRVAQ
jgi:[protein-PII] uridylyltransferase